MKIKSLNSIPTIHEGMPGKLGARMMQFSEIGRRDIVDSTGLIGGIYLITSQSLARNGIECEGNPECNSEIISIESRIAMAIDQESRVYTLPELLAEDEDIVDIISETNLQLLLCLDHKKGLIKELIIPKHNVPGEIIDMTLFKKGPKGRR